MTLRHLQCSRRSLSQVFVLQLLAVYTVVHCGSAVAQLTPGANVTSTPIAEAYSLVDLNDAAFRNHGLYTVDQQQFAVYYDANGTIAVSRRFLGASNWDTLDTGFTEFNSNLRDGHNTISFGIDGNGVMHMSWGMHNDDLVYAHSNGSVLGTGQMSFNPLSSMTGQNEVSVTYPQFYNLPDGDLLFTARNGKSGRGDTFLNRYDSATETWSTVHSVLTDGDPGQGVATNNAYPNLWTFDSQGDLHMTWTNRYNSSSPAGEVGYQTNHNIYYARSSDEGQTFTKMDGTPYSLPISELNAEIAVAIPEGSSLMNNTGMTTDQNDYPVVASWWAPESANGNHTRQYMLEWFDGQDWQVSQITNRPDEPKLAESPFLKNMGRPIVVVDNDDRVIVALRYSKEEGNGLTIAYSENRTDWEFLDLTTEDLGVYEPVYDPVLWKRENKLHFLYQPMTTGPTTSTIGVLEWDAAAFFEGFATRLTLQVDRNTGATLLVNATEGPITFDGYSIALATGQLSPQEWMSLQDQSLPGWEEANPSSTRLSELHQLGAMTLNSGEQLNLGNAFAATQVAFGEDVTPNIKLEFTTPDGGTRIGGVEFLGESLNNLILTVDPDTGRAQLTNGSDFDVSIDAYTIESADGSLVPADGAWNSLEDQNALGGGWEEANVSAQRLTEILMTGGATIESGLTLELGMLFNPQSDTDLEFNFFVEDESELRNGLVRYESLGLPGDFDADNDVDGADFLAWQRGLGLTTNDSDLALWQQGYGNTNVSSASMAVPEPTTVGLLGIAFVTAFFTGWKRNVPV